MVVAVFCNLIILCDIFSAFFCINMKFVQYVHFVSDL